MVLGLIYFKSLDINRIKNARLIRIANYIDPIQISLIFRHEFLCQIKTDYEIMMEKMRILVQSDANLLVCNNIFLLTEIMYITMQEI